MVERYEEPAKDPKTFRHEHGTAEYEKDPDECPICHQRIVPIKQEVEHFVEPGEVMESGLLQIVYRCPNLKCQRLFIANFTHSFFNQKQMFKGKFKLYSTAPFKIKLPDVEEEIKKISQNYVEIFQQSFAAEKYGLNQIAGMGYRKALEFLVKDYCIEVHPDKTEEIKKTWLGPCIKIYIDDAEIKDCAQLAAWLGNDETHYTRLWKDKDIDDLKNLLEITVFWIIKKIRTKKYLEDMPGRPKQ